jgi:hypothetical protein
MKKLLVLILFALNACMANGQNIGIGTTTPTRAKLEVHGVAGNGKTSAVFGSDAAGVSFQRNMPAIGFNQYRDNASGNGKFIAYGYGAVQYLDPATGIMAIDMMGGGSVDASPFAPKRTFSFNNSGNVTIGGTSHDYALTVSRANSANATAYLFGTKHHSAFSFGAEQHTYIRAGLDNGIVFINDIPGSKVVMSGFVGINTATPAYPLEIRQPAGGHGFVLVEPANFANWEFSIINGYTDLHLNNAGGVGKGYFKATDGSYNTYSDSRLKTNITAMPSLLSKFMQLQPVKYEMIHGNDEHRQSIGFIAQDVKKLFPELVTISTDTVKGSTAISDLHTLNYDGFSILTIKAMQEQQTIIHQQQVAIDALRKKLASLKEMVNTLKYHP